MLRLSSILSCLIAVISLGGCDALTAPTALAPVVVSPKRAVRPIAGWVARGDEIRVNVLMDWTTTLARSFVIRTFLL